MEEYKLPKINVIDNAYQETLNKYNQAQATKGLIYGMINHNYKYITSNNNARGGLINLLYADYFHILADYTISNYSLNKNGELLLPSEVNKYAVDFDGNLEYNKEKSLNIFVSAIVENPFYAAQLLMGNQKIKEVVIESFITDRYLLNKKDILDNCEVNISRVLPNSKIQLITKEKLNSACYEMRKNEINELQEINFSNDGDIKNK